MFKKVFFLGLTAGVGSALACLIYVKMYAKLVDFSEGASIISIISNCILISIAACFLYFALQYVLKREKIAEFIFNLIYALFSFYLVFYVLEMDDPTFKNENASLMADYYKGFLMPMLFFPVLAWFTFKPLFLKTK